MISFQKTIPLAVLIVAAASCSMKAVDAPATDGQNGSVISLSRESFSTKSSLSGDAAVWTAGDEVAVYQNENESAKKFIAEGSGAKVNFKVQDGEKPLGNTGNYWLVYPYSAAGDATVSSNAVSVCIPAVQKAVKGSFDPAAAIAVASGTDCTAGFLFKNAHTLFKVTVPDGFGADVAQIRLSANVETEKLAGDFIVTFDAASPQFTAEETSVSTVTLEAEGGASLAPGAYYIVSAPVTVASGICAELVGADGRVYFKYSTKGKTFERNVIYDLGAPVQNAGTSVVLDSKYYTEGTSFVYGGRENIFPATVSGVTNAAFTELPDGWNARLESDKLVVVPSTDSEAGVYEIKLFAYADGAKADIYSFSFKYDPTLILYDDFDGNDIDDRYWRRFNDSNSVLWNWFQTGEEAQSTVADGKLQLKAVYENGTYKTGAITGNGKFNYPTPFRIDCRAAMSKRETGFWCAIWTVPVTGYQDGEIDIMEAGDHYTSADFTSKAFFTCHNQYTLNTPSSTYDLWRPGQDQPQSGNCVLSNPTEYHVYSVEVTDEAVVWYLDGVQVHKYANIHHTTSDKGYKYAAESTVNSAGNTVYPKANYFKNYTFTEHNYFAIFDIAVGSSFVGGQNDKTQVPVSTDFNAQFDVDWIKISKIN